MINRLNKMLTFFVIIETFVIVSLMQEIDEKSLFNIILYLFIFTFKLHRTEPELKHEIFLLQL